MAVAEDAVVNVTVHVDAPRDYVTLVVEISPEARADLKRLVATGLFGLTISDCAARFIDAGLQQKAVEGWLAMPAFVEPKPRMAAKKRRRR